MWPLFARGQAGKRVFRRLHKNPIMKMHLKQFQSHLCLISI